MRVLHLVNKDRPFITRIAVAIQLRLPEQIRSNDEKHEGCCVVILMTVLSLVDVS